MAFDPRLPNPAASIGLLPSPMLSLALLATSPTRVGLHVLMGYLFFLGLGGLGEYQSRGEDIEAKEEGEGGVG